MIYKVQINTTGSKLLIYNQDCSVFKEYILRKSIKTQLRLRFKWFMPDPQTEAAKAYIKADSAQIEDILTGSQVPTQNW